MFELDANGEIVVYMDAEELAAANAMEENAQAAPSATVDHPKGETGGALKRPRPRSKSGKVDSKRVGVSTSPGSAVSKPLRSSPRERTSSTSSSEEDTFPRRRKIFETADSTRSNMEKMETALSEDDVDNAYSLLQCLRKEFEYLISELKNKENRCTRRNENVKTADDAQQ